MIKRILRNVPGGHVVQPLCFSHLTSLTKVRSPAFAISGTTMLLLLWISDLESEKRNQALCTRGGAILYTHTRAEHNNNNNSIHRVVKHFLNLWRWSFSKRTHKMCRCGFFFERSFATKKKSKKKCVYNEWCSWLIDSKRMFTMSDTAGWLIFIEKWVHASCYSLLCVSGFVCSFCSVSVGACIMLLSAVCVWFCV